MSAHKIDAYTKINVAVTRFGAGILDKITANEFEPERAGGRWQGATMQLWEFAQIFGPHIKSGMRVPFLGIEFDVPEDPAELRLRHQAHERRFAADKLANEQGTALADLMRVAVDPDIDYVPPELRPGIASRWLDERVPVEPDDAGRWWLGDDVVRVEWGAVEDQSEPCHISGGRRLIAILRNNRRKPVADLEGWGGPALRDPRLPAPKDESAKATADDEDIPF